MAQHYHFIGIGGIGMSALAHILLQQGKKVSGSDINPSYVTESLEKAGADLFFGHAAENISKDAVVVYSTDIKSENPELKAAHTYGLVLQHRAELLADLMEPKHALLVAGTHGKTTTSALLAHVLVNAGLLPSFAVGGMIATLGTNGGYGEGECFVAEADESDGSFLKYSPFGAILTNIGKDHLDHWKTFDALILGFTQFAHTVASSHHFFWCGDDPLLVSLQLPGISYGFNEKNALQILSYRQEGWRCFFELNFKGVHYDAIEIPLVGKHNVLNATAVFGMGLQLNIPEESIRAALHCFRGVARRAELKADVSSIAIFDDYAHHPTEIATTVQAFKKAVGQRRLVIAFQPHRYTRTRDCMEAFGKAFAAADLVVVTDIYSAREAPIENVTIEALLLQMKSEAANEICYIERKALSASLAALLQPEDILVTMGAGDITHVGLEVAQCLK